MGRGWRATPGPAEDYVHQAGPRLLRFARSLTLHDADAEDLVQDTLVKVIVKWGQVSRAGDTDRYVRRIMVNTFISSRRLARTRTVVSDEVVDHHLPALQGSDVGVGERLLADVLLATLDARSRTVLVLRYLEDLPDEAIADALDTTPGNVRVIAHRALSRLRPLLTERRPSADGIPAI